MAECTQPNGSVTLICDDCTIDPDNYLWVCLNDATHKARSLECKENDFCDDHINKYLRNGWVEWPAD